MDDVGAREVVAALTATIDFGKKISSVLHTLGAQDRTIGSCDFVLISDGATRVLSQLQELVQQDLNDFEAKPALFNQAGLNYVKVAADEVRLVFLMFEGTSLKEYVGRRRADVITTNVKGTAKEEIEKRGTPVVVDESALIKKMENLALLNSKKLIDWVNRLTDRLDDLKNHLHLIQQVVSVHGLTRSSDGMKDIRIIVDSYDRIQRFAEKTGVLSDYGRRPRGSRRRSVSNSSDSESDSDSLDDRRPRQKRVSPKSSTETLRPRTFAECNGRRASVTDIVDISSPPSFSPAPVPNEQSDIRIPIAPPNPCCGPNNPHIIDISNLLPKNQPPEYSEKERSASMGQRMTTDASIPSTPTIVGSPCLDEKSLPLQSDEKEVHQKDSDASSVATYETRSSDATSVSSTNENQYIKEMKSTRWRFKSFFRSKQSLEAEMQNNLRDDNKYLSAYLLQGRKSRKIPHSDIHSVEWTHINTIIAQMKGNGWYETFTNLSAQEQRAYDEMMPGGAELLALKIVKTNQRNAWARMLVRLAGGSNDLPHLRDGRIILAIIREEEHDDDSSSFFSSSSSDSEDERPRLSRPPPPPLPRFNPPFFRRPPPPPPPPPVIGFKSNPPPVPVNGCNPPHPGPCPPLSLPIRNSSPPAQGVPRHIVPNIKPLIVPDTEHHARRRPNAIPLIPGFRPPPLPAPPARSTNICSVRISDVAPTTPQNESDAVFALTAYESYTLRPRAPVDDNRPIAWGCCSVTHEVASQASLRACVGNYTAAGNNIIADKMKLTEGQALQVARLVDGLNAHESDIRFMWTLAELSFFNLVGDPVRHQWNSLNTAVMHVTAVRQPLENLNAMQIFEDIRRCFDAPVFPPVHVDGATGVGPAPRPPWRPAGDSESYDSDSSSSSGSDGGRPRRNWRCWNKAIRIKLDPADKEVDLVKRLLKLWTCE